MIDHKTGVFVDEQLNHNHNAVYEVFRYSQYRKDFPLLKRVFHRINIKLSGEGCPVNGKGENSWDCGVNYIRDVSFGIGFDPIPDDIVEFANSELDKTVRRDRSKYGCPVKIAS